MGKIFVNDAIVADLLAFLSTPEADHIEEIYFDKAGNFHLNKNNTCAKGAVISKEDFLEEYTPKDAVEDPAAGEGGEGEENGEGSGNDEDGEVDPNDPNAIPAKKAGPGRPKK